MDNYISTILGNNQSIFRKEKEMSQQSSTTALKELDEQLTCNVCLDQYTNPKTLPCLHSFCLKCIEKIHFKYKGGSIQFSLGSCHLSRWTHFSN